MRTANETAYILSSPSMTARIKNAEKDIAKGKGVKIELTSFEKSLEESRQGKINRYASVDDFF